MMSTLKRTPNVFPFVFADLAASIGFDFIAPKTVDVIAATKRTDMRNNMLLQRRLEAYDRHELEFNTEITFPESALLVHDSFYNIFKQQFELHWSGARMMHWRNAKKDIITAALEADEPIVLNLVERNMHGFLAHPQVSPAVTEYVREAAGEKCQAKGIVPISKTVGAENLDNGAFKANAQNPQIFYDLTITEARTKKQRCMIVSINLDAPQTVRLFFDDPKTPVAFENATSVTFDLKAGKTELAFPLPEWALPSLRIDFKGKSAKFGISDLSLGIMQ